MDMARMLALGDLGQALRAVGETEPGPGTQLPKLLTGADTVWKASTYGV